MELSNLSFIENNAPGRVHEIQEFTGSSSIEHLIAQNEDSAARLKVALRRLALIEEENKKLREEYLRISEAFTHAKDQVLVSKEKDKSWKTKLDSLQREAREAVERANILQTANERINIELERHQRYQQRVRDQIKPYVATLKEYSQKLSERNAELEKEINRRDIQLHNVREQIEKITQTAAEQIHLTQEKLDRVTHNYEIERRDWLKDAERVIVLEREADTFQGKLSKLTERLSLVENENIEIRRLKEKQKDELMAELIRAQERIQELSTHNQKLGMEHSDLQLRVLEDAETIKNMKSEINQNREQLTSLRYLWSQKNEESEGLKMAMSALEKLNSELSTKLNDYRGRENSHQG